MGVSKSSKCYIDINILDFVQSGKSRWDIVLDEFTTGEQDYLRSRIKEFDVKLIRDNRRSNHWMLVQVGDYDKVGEMSGIGISGALRKKVETDYFK
jgi:hypothetical protein